MANYEIDENCKICFLRVTEECDSLFCDHKCKHWKPIPEDYVGWQGNKKRCGNCEHQNLNFDEGPCVYCKYNEYTKTVDSWEAEK